LEQGSEKQRVRDPLLQKGGGEEFSCVEDSDLGGTESIGIVGKTSRLDLEPLFRRGGRGPVGNRGITRKKGKKKG